MTEALVVIRNVSKSFGPNQVLDSFSLDIDPGVVKALVGHNGSGKSTLIKVLSGYHIPDQGAEVVIAGDSLDFGAPDQAYRMGCRFVHQNLGLIADCSVLDNLLLTSGFPTRFGTISRRASIRKAEAAFGRLGVEVCLTDLVGNLPPARRTAVAIARALLDDPAHPPRLLVMDEPTATMPAPEVESLLELIRAAAAQDVAILYVTHHLDEALNLADGIIVLRDGHTVARFSRGEIDKKALTEVLVGEQIGSLPVAGPETQVEQNGAQSALRVSGLSGPELTDVSLTVRRGEILGIAGLLGSGRETLLPSIFGALPRTTGTVEIEGVPLPADRPDKSIAAGIAYLPADREVLGGIMTLSAYQNMTLPNLRPFWKRGRLDSRLERVVALEMFKSLGVHPVDAIDEPLQFFSGGNQQKILIGKWLRQNPVVFLLDEPTQGVDVGAQAELHRQLLVAAQNGAALVISSSDSEELALLCDRVAVLHNGTIADELTGSDITMREIDLCTLNVGTTNAA